jgi:ribulose-phosphate 3-epimerase
MVLIAPSLLSADFTRLEDAVRLLEDAGADVIHVDVMDGHFVPNLTFGPRVVELLKARTKLPLDVHLMVDTPSAVVPWFLDAGADWISIHAEASAHLHRDISLIRTAGRKAGVALNPATSLVVLEEILRDLDFVLLMCVNPGRGSQPFIESSREKIRALRRRRDDLGLVRPWIEIDGGVNLLNVGELAGDGAEIFVAGNAVFNAPEPREAVRLMKAAARRAGTP